MTPNWKPSATERKKKKLERRKNVVRKETDAKLDVRRRDKRCRFPLCGCQGLGLLMKAWPEVSHQQHKGIGGNPDGTRSTAAGMIFLCKHRHQDGAVSRHRGTLRAVPLTPSGMNGPIVWEVDEAALRAAGNLQGPRWRELAREKAVQQLAELTPWQRATLETLRRMDL